METENKVISQNKTTNNNNKIINTNKTVNNIIKCQQNYEYMIANFELSLLGIVITESSSNVK